MDEKCKDLIAWLHEQVNAPGQTPQEAFSMMQTHAAALEQLFFGVPAETPPDEEPTAQRLACLVADMLPDLPTGATHLTLSVRPGCLPRIAAHTPARETVLLDAADVPPADDPDARERRMEAECLLADGQMEEGFMPALRLALADALARRFALPVHDI